jgi:hypothetical protein
MSWQISQERTKNPPVTYFTMPTYQSRPQITTTQWGVVVGHPRIMYIQAGLAASTSLQQGRRTNQLAKRFHTITQALPLVSLDAQLKLLPSPPGRSIQTAGEP